MKQKTLATFVFSLIFLTPLLSKDLTISYIDVGQGDSELIELPNGKTILVDAGPGSDRSGGFDAGKDSIMPYLVSRGISKLDCLVITHPHFDHFGGIFYLINHIKIGKIIDPGFAGTARKYEELLTLILQKKIKYGIVKKGDELDYDGDVQIEVLSPPDSKYYEDPNSASIVFKLTYEHTAFLFTGDMQRLTEETVVTDFGDDLSCDIIKVPHHGSASSSSESFLDKVAPKFAVISCGYNNRFRHPHKKVLELYKEKNVQIHRTDLDGTIIITSDGKTLDIKTVPKPAN